VLPEISSSVGRKFRILVAEDNAINQKVITLVLRETGFEVDVVANGRSAIAAHRSKPYDLILMDLQMPGVDGLEPTRQIRKLSEKQPVIVAVTADVMAGVREKCRAAGMDAYLAKPFTRHELLSVVLDVHKRLTAADTVPKAS
jgi:CheY-like chemotaxis protein